MAIARNRFYYKVAYELSLIPIQTLVQTLNLNKFKQFFFQPHQ